MARLGRRQPNRPIVVHGKTAPAAGSFAFVQESSGTTGTTTPTSYTVTLPSATTGNTVIIIVSSDNTVATPSGFVLDRSQVNDNGHYVFRKAVSTGESSWVVSPAAGASGVWYVAELSGIIGLDKVNSTGASITATTRSTGTTATTAQNDEILFASFGTSEIANPPATWSGETNGFVERIADQITTKTTGTNVALAVAALQVSATGAYTSTATAQRAVASTGIIVTYSINVSTLTTVSDAETSSSVDSVTVVRPKYVGGFALGSTYDFDTTNLTTDFDAIQAAHGAYIRFDVDWWQIEGTQGTRVWTPVDNIVTAANNRGLKSILLIHRTPPWANSGTGENVYAPATNVTNFQDFCQAVVERYGPQGVTLYEIGNEVNLPDSNGRLTPSATTYLNGFLIPGATGIRIGAANVGIQAKVLFAGLGPGDSGGAAILAETFISSAYTAGAKPYFDIMSYHPYAGDQPEGGTTGNPGYNISGRVTAIRSAMDSNGDTAKKIWGTEYGRPTNDGPGGSPDAAETSTEARQTEHVYTAYSTWNAQTGVGPLLWYTVRDKQLYAASTAREDFFGVFRSNGVAKPAYQALMDGFSSLGEETGSVAESVTTLARTGVNESSTSVDNAALTVSLVVSETGSSVDSASLTVTLSVTETSTSVDVGTLPATPISAAETGSSVDSVSAKASTATETSFSTDTSTDTARSGIGETSGSAETATVTVTLSVSETGIANDAVTVRSIATTEQSTATENATDRTLSTVDSSNAADSVSAKDSISIDTSSSVDTATLSAAITASENSLSTEIITVRTITSSDVSAGNDTVSSLVGGNNFIDADTSIGVESVTTFTRTGIGETSSAADNAVVFVTLSTSDSSTSNDAVSLFTRILTESGSGTDVVVSVSTDKFGADTVSSVDNAGLSTANSRPETATSVETASITVALSASETVSSVDNATLQVVLSVADSAHGTDAGTLFEIPLKTWLSLSLESSATNRESATQASTLEG